MPPFGGSNSNHVKLNPSPQISLCCERKLPQAVRPFYHFDVYRIGDAEEMDEIGYEDYFFGNGLCIIEWAERIKELIPAEARQIIIEKNLEKGFAYRRILIEGQ